MSTGTLIEISTAHITENDDRVLGAMVNGRHPMPLNIADIEYGYIIVIPYDRDYFNEKRQDCEDEGYDLSDSFWKLMQYAFDNGHRAIILDRDADEIEDLETHDW